MKKIFSLLFLAFAIQSFAQTGEDVTFDEVNTHLIGKWKIEKVVADGENVPLKLDIEVEYFADNTFVAREKNKADDKKKWQLFSDRKGFSIIFEKLDPVKILSIDAKSLVLSKVFAADLDGTRESITYYFVRKE